MHAQAAANARCADQLLHEVGLLAFQLGELVGDDQQVGQRLADPLLPVQPLVLDDIHAGHVQGLFRLMEDGLAANQLALDGLQGAPHGIAVQVGDDAGGVGQLLKGLGHAAALVVDEKECYFFRAEAHGRGENVGHDQLRLAGAGHAGDQTVLAVAPLMHVQAAEAAVLVNADGHGQGIGRVVALPAGEHVQRMHVLYAEQIQKRYALRDAGGGIRQIQVKVGQGGYQPARLPEGAGLRGEGQHPAARFLLPDHAPLALVNADDRIAAAGQASAVLRQGNHPHSPVGTIQQQPADHAALGNVVVHQEDDKLRLARLQYGLPASLHRPVGQHAVQDG